MTNTDKTVLLPCPWCGGTNVTFDNLTFGSGQVLTVRMVHQCGEDWPFMEFSAPTKEEAIAAWNTRTQEPAEVKRCFICNQPFKAGEMVLSSEDGLGHRVCFGEDRAGYVKDLGSLDPLGPNDPIPTGWPYEPEALRAASITPPASERSKEEVGVKALEIAKRWAIWIDDASAGEEDEGGYLRATFEADKAALLAALSKPGEQG